MCNTTETISEIRLERRLLIRAIAWMREAGLKDQAWNLMVTLAETPDTEISFPRCRDIIISEVAEALYGE